MLLSEGKMYRVKVLVSTYNGEKYLKEQLDSILSQTNVLVDILVRDDGSTDNTINILKEYEEKELLHWYRGKNIKPAKSFLDLMRTTDKADYYAFSDQDDFWLNDKLQIAIEDLNKEPSDMPLLYYGSPRIVDEQLNPLQYTVKDTMLDFNSMLINSNATGCTMVFNNCLLNLINQTSPNYIAMHDAWLHKVCMVSGGKLVYDDDVHILYRQHSNNVIGISNSKVKKIIRHFYSIKQRACVRSKTIASLIECYGSYMEDEQLKKALLVAGYKKSLKNTFLLFTNKEIRTTNKRRNFLFKCAVLLRVF